MQSNLSHCNNELWYEVSSIVKKLSEKYKIEDKLIWNMLLMYVAHEAIHPDVQELWIP